MTLPVMYGFEGEPGRARAPRAWPRFMTARVAADYADSSPWTIRRHVRPCGRRGRSFVYAIESVEEWMRGLHVKHAAEQPTVEHRSRASQGSNRVSRDRTDVLNEPAIAARVEHVAA
jgi:hypothetical protein